MSRQKRCICLSDTERITLGEAVKNHSKPEFHRACQALLWSHEGYSVKKVAAQTKVSRQSVSKWLTSWQQQGLTGLMRQKGQGRKPILSLSTPPHQQHNLTKALSAHDQVAECIKAD